MAKYYKGRPNHLYWKDIPEDNTDGILIDDQAWHNFLICFEALFDIEKIPEHLR